MSSPSESSCSSLDSYIAQVKGGLPFLFLGIFMAAIMVMMSIMLFIFSAPSSRKRPIFILNVFSLCFGLVDAVGNIYGQIHTMLSPNTPQSTAELLLFVSSFQFAPMIAELALIIRLFAVLPRVTTARRTYAIVIGIPVLMKVGRLVNFILFLVLAAQRSAVQSDGQADAQGKILQIFGGGNFTAELILHLVDNTMIKHDSRMSSTAIIRSGMFLSLIYNQMLKSHAGSWTTRVRGLLLISLTNFLLPVLMDSSILLVWFIAGANEAFVSIASLFMANGYVIIVSVVFATIWTMGYRFKEDHRSQEIVLSTLRGEPGQRSGSHIISYDSPQAPMGDDCHAIPITRIIKILDEFLIVPTFAPFVLGKSKAFVRPGRRNATGQE
ncbi:hypothetical protein CONPUDRAFT_74282 [Coniophora puteana RWD-64-598 SS2]|uniref:Uncharacterized protein n=1 Tax=Coniophora puteana (strain RWD-64-598) TaxID=741705 RepID=A0A5M3ML80_CONPW|nr:uncharacterized protein CONPUDRAFT_74282 [Coniophora puteana RWD-64-598 SS2]EIW79992.1 hypothetical protein CONPUDRAFT_74282 [Coniophora puteana RWD-64-598 SS2]